MTNDLSQIRVSYLVELVDKTIVAAENVPLGSLAQAISRRLDCIVTLWPMEQLKHLPHQKRCIQYARWNGEAHEYVVFYAPSDEKPDSMDAVTRYCVAHELAHILLKHPHESGGHSTEREQEAHFLATLFLWLHGPVVRRECPPFVRLLNIFAQTDLPDQAKWNVLTAFVGVVTQRKGWTSQDTDITSPTAMLPPHREVLRPEFPRLPSQWIEEDQQIAEQTLRRYETEPEFRQSMAALAESTFTKGTKILAGV